jgi:hypothetical protein
MTLNEIILMLRADRIRVNPSHESKWFKLSGDIDAKEYGAYYIRCDSFAWEVMNFTGRDWDGYNEGCDYRDRVYMVTEHSLDNRDIDESFDQFANFVDASLDDEIETVTCGVTDLICGYVSYGLGHNDTRQDTSFKRLLNDCSVDSAWVPSDYWIVIE